MNPRKPLSFRQDFAQGGVLRDIAFALRSGFGDAETKGPRIERRPCQTVDCNPSLRLRSGPNRVGPIFCRPVTREIAALWITKNFLFPSTGNALESATIKTPTRGRTSCTRPSPSSPFSPCRLPAAWKTPHRAVWPGLRAGLSSLTPSTATSSPVPSSAALLALRRAASILVRASATDLASGNGRPFTPRPSGHPARMAFLHVRKAA